MKSFIILFSLLSVAFASDTLDIKPFQEIKDKRVDEGSGIIKSKKYKNIYWTHNDSGNKAVIYALPMDKKLTKKNIKKVKIKGASNVDWEDIAYYGDKILIGDFGNNENKRKDLCIYMIDEPNPYKDKKVKVLKKIRVELEDQKKFPPKIRSFDVEAIYSLDNNIYVLSKHRDDNNTKLYKLESFDKKINKLKIISTFDIKGMVTAADISEDGKYVAVLTYSGIWLFEINGKENIFNSKKYYKKLKKRQYEAISFDGDDLIITNEKGKIYRVSILEMKKV